MTDDTAFLSRRAKINRARENLLAVGLTKWSENPYIPTTNPNGIINLGTAENKLMSEELIQSLKLPPLTPTTLLYGSMPGLPELRTSLATLFNNHFSPHKKLDPSNIIVTNGGCSALSNLIHGLCDAGEGVLIPAPYYGGFKADVSGVSGGVIVPVYGNGNDDDYGKEWLPTVNDLENALNQHSSNLKIRILLLTNPNNPTARIIPPAILQSYITFAQTHSLHLIVDEIYALSTFSDQPFKSILSHPEFTSPTSTIHAIYSLSKDFGLSGLRCGCIISYNTSLLHHIRPITPFSALPNTTQLLISAFLSSPHINAFIQTNQNRLRECYTHLTILLHENDIPFMEANAGFFLMADLRKWVGKAGGEMALFGILLESGVYVAPGKAFGIREEGWFRVVFAVEREVVSEAMGRLVGVLEGLDT